MATKATQTGKRKHAVKGNDEIYPAADGVKVEFRVNEEEEPGKPRSMYTKTRSVF